MRIPQKVGPYKKLQKLCDAINDLIDLYISLRPATSLNVYTSHTSVGVKRQAVAEEVTSSNRNFRGEYSQAVAYAVGDEVLVSVGPEAGTYLTIQSVPANPTGNATYFPWAGTGYFVLVGRLNDQSSWL